MTSIGTGYDLSPTTFSPDGRLFQVEYADEAVQRSGTTLGIKVKDGIVLAVERIVANKMLEDNSNCRVTKIDRHAGMALAGIYPDCRKIVSTAREEALNYFNLHNMPISGQVLTSRVSNTFQMYTMYSSLRPFGCSVLIAACDPKNGLSLSRIEPSGASYGHHFCAIGKGKQLAATELGKLNLESLSLVDATNHLARILYMTHDEVKDRFWKVEMAWIKDGSYEVVPKNVYDEAINKAQQSLDDDDSDDD
eukprot:GCRY01001020.1.p1 GENE.GCRY01001020.1~~GCRY01001020.1.p1  ORF type:complete len:250 (+),score=12.69 GCRY01001020.1:191-940(+)